MKKVQAQLLNILKDLRHVIGEGVKSSRLCHVTKGGNLVVELNTWLDARWP